MSVVYSYIRIGAAILFLCCTIRINFSWYSLASFVGLIGTIVILRGAGRTDEVGDNQKSNSKNSNPLKGKPRNVTISEERQRMIKDSIYELVAYDAENSETLDNFEIVKSKSECIFAKKARLWGAKNWDEALTLEENIYRSMAMFLNFALVCEELGLDGFLFELPGNKYGNDVQVFGDAVRRVLTVLSDHDPSKVHCMNKSYIGQRGWVFEFNRVTMFVTTFAPCYPEHNSRYAHGAQNAYILCQPEISFAQTDLPFDTPETNWDQPATVRDKIRVAFKNAGREYKIPATLFYPMAHDLVKPLDEMNGSVVEWWKKG